MSGFGVPCGALLACVRVGACAHSVHTCVPAWLCVAPSRRGRSLPARAPARGPSAARTSSHRPNPATGVSAPCTRRPCPHHVPLPVSSRVFDGGLGPKQSLPLVQRGAQANESKVGGPRPGGPGSSANLTAPPVPRRGCSCLPPRDRRRPAVLASTHPGAASGVAGNLARPAAPRPGFGGADSR